MLLEVVKEWKYFEIKKRNWELTLLSLLLMRPLARICLGLLFIITCLASDQNLQFFLRKENYPIYMEFKIFSFSSCIDDRNWRCNLNWNVIDAFNVESCRAYLKLLELNFGHWEVYKIEYFLIVAITVNIAKICKEVWWSLAFWIAYAFLVELKFSSVLFNS